MIKKSISAASLLLTALVYISLGATVMIWSDESVFVVRVLLTVLVCIHGGLTVIRAFTDKSILHIIGSVLLGISNFGVGFILIAFPSLFQNSITIIFGLWILINALVRMIVYYQYRRNRVQSRFLTLWGAIFSAVFAFVLLTRPSRYYPSIMNLLGIYIIIYGLTFLLDFIREVIPQSATDRMKRRMRFGVPTVIAAFIPRMFVNAYNNFMAVEKDEATRKEWLSEMQKSTDQPEMEVFIHTGDGPTTQFGHMDIFFDGKVYSYGSYDEASQRMWAAAGDGVLFTTEAKEEYLKFCIETNQKTIVSFGVSLTKAQTEAVRKEIDKIFKDLTPWTCEAERTKKAGGDPTVFTDYASMLHNATEAVFYKFLRGRYKSYFVMGSNCVMLADQIIGSSGSDVLSINGIITPGAYYNYLNTEFLRPMGMVVTRTVYSAESFGLESMHKSYKKEGTLHDNETAES